MNVKDFSEGEDKDFLMLVLKKIVEHPEDVQVDRAVDEMGVLLTVRVNKADMGKVVGREGQNAKALRCLLRIIGSKNNSRVNMKIEDPKEE